MNLQHDGQDAISLRCSPTSEPQRWGKCLSQNQWHTAALVPNCTPPATRWEHYSGVRTGLSSAIAILARFSVHTFYSITSSDSQVHTCSFHSLADVRIPMNTSVSPALPALMMVPVCLPSLPPASHFPISGIVVFLTLCAVLMERHRCVWKLGSLIAQGLLPYWNYASGRGWCRWDPGWCVGLGWTREQIPSSRWGLLQSLCPVHWHVCLRHKQRLTLSSSLYLQHMKVSWTTRHINGCLHSSLTVCRSKALCVFVFSS